MYDEGKLPSKGKQSHPWASPGSAHEFGEGCGVNGGNPNGCVGQGKVPYGTCCPGGKNLIEETKHIHFQGNILYVAVNYSFVFGKG